MKIISGLGLLLFCLPFLAESRTITPRDSIQVTKVWDKGKHNAFTDLIRFQNAFYLSFREGESHVGGENNGKVRILKSGNGKKWESVALLEVEGLDLRDPKLSVTPENKLMVIMAGAVFGKRGIEELFPMVSFSDQSGKTFSLPERARLDPAIVPSKDWIWRVTWHNGIGYGIDYQLKENEGERRLLKKDAWLLYLMQTKDGKSFEKVAQLAVEELPNESTIRFDEKGNMHVLIRKEQGDMMGVLATSQFPYKDWRYTKLDYRLGGPNFLFLNDQQLLVGTRKYLPETSTVLLVTDLKGSVQKTVTLPSGGDTSYPGMLVHKNNLWVSYYSAHEGKSNIYFAKIPMKTFKVK